jgi:hypothetical protein
MPLGNDWTLGFPIKAPACLWVRVIGSLENSILSSSEKTATNNFYRTPRTRKKVCTREKVIIGYTYRYEPSSAHNNCTGANLPSNSFKHHIKSLLIVKPKDEKRHLLFFFT